MMALFDLEGTLTCSSHREHLRKAGNFDEYNDLLCEDPPNKEVLKRLFNIYESGTEIIIITAKPEEYRNDVLIWLDMYNIPYDHIVMRKPFDKRTSPEIKEDFVLRNKRHIVKCFDDRADVIAMYKNHGLTAIKVRNI